MKEGGEREKEKEKILEPVQGDGSGEGKQKMERRKRGEERRGMERKRLICYSCGAVLADSPGAAGGPDHVWPGDARRWRSLYK